MNAWRAKEAAEILEPAVVAFGDLVDDPALAAIEHQLARAYWFQDENEEAIDLADRALGRAERIEAAGLIADVLITKGALLAFASRPYEGAGALEAGHPARRVARPQRRSSSADCSTSACRTSAATRGCRSIAAAPPHTLAGRFGFAQQLSPRRSAMPARPRSCSASGTGR